MLVGKLVASYLFEKERKKKALKKDNTLHSPSRRDITSPRTPRTKDHQALPVSRRSPRRSEGERNAQDTQDTPELPVLRDMPEHICVFLLKGASIFWEESQLRNCFFRKFFRNFIVKSTVVV